MKPALFKYLSIRNDSELESDYIGTLREQFEITAGMELNNLALFAYHLLFICYFNQILNKMRIWFPDEQSMAFVSFESERRKKFREAQNPTDYAHKGNRERSLFELLNLFCDCEDVVKKCKKLVDHRNERLGHVNYLVLSEDEFFKQMSKYDEAVEAIHTITMDGITRSQNEFIETIDKRQVLTKDDIDLGLVGPYKLSQADLGSLFESNSPRTELTYKRINKVLQEDFDIVNQ
jgi:hypothetical protein